MKKHLVDLGHIAKYIQNDNDRKEVVLDILYEHACELRLSCLIEAVELYHQNHQNKADTLRPGQQDALDQIQSSAKQYLTIKEQDILPARENVNLMRGSEDDEGID